MYHCLKEKVGLAIGKGKKSLEGDKTTSILLCNSEASLFSFLIYNLLYCNTLAFSICDFKYIFRSYYTDENPQDLPLHPNLAGRLLNAWH